MADGMILVDVLPAEKQGGSLLVPIIGSLVGGVLLGGGFALATHAPNLTTYLGAGAGLGVVGVIGIVGNRAYKDAVAMREMGRAETNIEDAWTAHAMGEVDKAEELLKSALESCRRRLGMGHRTTVSTLHSLANLYRAKGQWKLAEQNYQQALPIYQGLSKRESPALGALYCDLSRCYAGQSKFEPAIAAGEKATEIFRRVMPADSPELAEWLVTLGQYYTQADRDEKASELFGEALEIQRKKLTVNDPTLLTTLGFYSRTLFKLRRYQETEQYITALLEQLEGNPEPDYPSLVEALLDLGWLRLEQGRYAEAEPLFIRGLKTLQHYVGPNDRLLKKVLDGYKELGMKAPETVRGAVGVVNLINIFFGERERLRQTFEEFPDWVNSRDATGWGPLQWAAFIGRDDLVRWLLNRGADPSYDAQESMGPLHVAAAWNRREAMLELLDKGADPNARGPGGWTPVFWATFCGRTKLVEMLIKKGADATKVDDYGRNALHVAATEGHLGCAVALLGAGANPNSKELGTGRTPLHQAAQFGHLAVCECLIFNRAEVRAQDKNGMTPLSLAEKRKHRLVVRAMKRHYSAGLGRSKK